MKGFFCFLLLLHWLPLNAQAATDSLSTKILQPADMQADFQYLRRLLEETHPALYRYTPKAQMQAKLDSMASTLNEPLPFYTFFKTVSALLGDIRCAHTHTLPGKNWREQFNSTLKTIPFFTIQFENRSYVLFNGTADQTVKPGFELLSINGQSMELIRRQLYRYHWDDGYIETSKVQAMRGQLFALFYYWYIGQPETYRLSFRSLSGDTVQVDAPAETFGASLKHMMANPVNKQMVAWYNQKKRRYPWRLYLPDTLASTAFLRLDGFGGGGEKNGAEAVTVFRKFMDKAMAKLAKKQIQHLIVDVRSNNGGWDSQGIELFTYLMKSDTAVPYYARQHSITDNAESEFFKFSDLSEADRKNVKNELIPEADGTFTLRQGSDTREPMRYAPKPNRFRGQVYILMNGESASTASEFLAVAHANKVGVFVGEESGGAYEGGNGSSFINLELPRSGIQVTTPLVYYRNAVPEPNQKGRGTLPNHPVPTTMQHVLTHTDPQLNYVVRLIREPAQTTGRKQLDRGK
ncbi:peptidase S41 [Fibrisoma limi BUZ 3]|uniref:Peptidase S41 n=1 Tax=Fibrisoma limi BUZ 3 TaxID=1185876 RepID=I2GT65_9BACT|nr:S41 family peptidase [Fibrisoma limi]CCH57094.1 peptidase S41 [Fibrisoma limi BUZ 3]